MDSLEILASGYISKSEAERTLEEWSNALPDEFKGARIKVMGRKKRGYIIVYKGDSKGKAISKSNVTVYGIVKD